MRIIINIKMDAIEMKATMLQDISSIDVSQVGLIEKLNKAVQRIISAAKKEPVITKEDLSITPFVASIGEGIKPIPEDLDVDAAKKKYLIEKYG